MTLQLESVHKESEAGAISIDLFWPAAKKHIFTPGRFIIE